MFACRSALAAAVILAGVVPAAAVCPGLDVLVEDQFDALRPVWGEARAGVRIDNGQLVLAPAAGTELWVVNNSGLLDDIDMCVTVTTIAGIDDSDSRAGPIFWYQDVNNFYVFEIAPNGNASVWRRQRGHWLPQVEWRAADGANKGDGGVNELRVSTAGNEATFSVNGTEFGTLNGSPPEDGQQIGLFAGSPDSGDATFSFDGLRVTKP